ncbi:zinc finger protein 311 [Rhinolophus ferrumequinum]|nr:zinc finger protein 311 [Rhinolophus ferrumequinum]
MSRESFESGRWWDIPVLLLRTGLLKGAKCCEHHSILRGRKGTEGAPPFRGPSEMEEIPAATQRPETEPHNAHSAFPFPVSMGTRCSPFWEDCANPESWPGTSLREQFPPQPPSTPHNLRKLLEAEAGAHLGNSGRRRGASWTVSGTLPTRYPAFAEDGSRGNLPGVTVTPMSQAHPLFPGRTMGFSAERQEHTVSGASDIRGCSCELHWSEGQSPVLRTHRTGSSRAAPAQVPEVREVSVQDVKFDNQWQMPMREKLREEKESCEKVTFEKVTKKVKNKKKLSECAKYGRNFRCHSDLIVHERIHSSEKAYVCNECGKALKTKSQLSVHQILHTGEKPFNCTQCGKAFSSRSALCRHRISHSGERPHKCRDCGKDFKTRTCLGVHQVMHTGEKPYECEECGKAFSRSSDLTKHTRIHTGERSYECTECGRAFSRSSDLSKHQRIHSQEKCYGCPQCGEAFSSKVELSKHRRIHMEEKPYKCKECGKAFRYNCKLRAHEREHMGKKPYRCGDCGKTFQDQHA